MDLEVFKLFEASSPGLKKLNKDKQGHYTDKDLVFEDYNDATRTLQALIKAKENEIAYRKELVFMLEKSKISFDDQFQKSKTNYANVKRLAPKSSLDKRLSEFLKTFPNLSQTGNDQASSNQQQQTQPGIIQPGFYTQHPPPLPTSMAGPSIMAMMSVPPPPLLPNSQALPIPSITGHHPPMLQQTTPSHHSSSSSDHDYRNMNSGNKRAKRHHSPRRDNRSSVTWK